MVAPSDDIPFLTASDLCRLAGIKRPRWAKWADDGHVRKGSRGKCYTVADVVELVGFTELVKALEYEDGVLAWASVREPLREALGSGPRLVLVDQRQRSGRLLGQLTDVGQAMQIGNPSVLLDLGATVDAALETCRRMQDHRQHRPAALVDEAVRPLRAVPREDRRS